MNKAPTVGLEFSFTTFQLSDGSLVNCNVLDTGGMEKFDAINESYYRNADCCLLVYDITDRKSFEECKDYYNIKLNVYSEKIVKIIVLGNKTDLDENRVIDQEEGANFAEENGYIFMETSCKDNYNVADAFTTLIEMTNVEYKKKGINTENKMGKKITKKKIKKNKKKKKSCC